MTSTTLALLIDGIIGLAVIVGGVVLLSIGKIDSTTGVAIIGAGVAVAKGATTGAIALKVPAPPPPTPGA